MSSRNIMALRLVRRGGTLTPMEHHTHWSGFSKPLAHGLAFEALVGCLVDGLAELGLVIEPSQLAFACMPSLGRRGEPLPPADLLLDTAAAAAHHVALVAAGCPMVEIRGAGWLPGRRYLVLLDHAWGRGAAQSLAAVWAESRGTVRPLSVASFERLERNRRFRPLVHVAARRWWRTSFDITVRPAWNVGPPSAVQGCPTTPLPAA